MNLALRAKSLGLGLWSEELLSALCASYFGMGASKVLLTQGLCSCLREGFAETAFGDSQCCFKRRSHLRNWQSVIIIGRPHIV